MRLFTYGTLQESAIQNTLFGRVLTGTLDQLLNYECKIGIVEIDIEKFDALVEKVGSKVNGVVYELSESEIQITDVYEGKGYKRIEVNLLSGIKAWVYVLA